MDQGRIINLIKGICLHLALSYQLSSLRLWAKIWLLHFGSQVFVYRVKGKTNLIYCSVLSSTNAVFDQAHMGQRSCESWPHQDHFLPR